MESETLFGTLQQSKSQVGSIHNKSDSQGGLNNLNIRLAFFLKIHIIDYQESHSYLIQGSR